MRHTLLYMGRLSLNFDALTPQTKYYRKPDGTEALHSQASKLADGVAFGYMEKPGAGAFAVSIGPVILDVPLKLEPSRHSDGKEFGPNPSLFGDESARRLLADAIRINPQKAEVILEHVWMKIGGA